MGECWQQKHIQHATSTKTECDYLYGWIRKWWQTQKCHPKWWTPEIKLGRQKKKKKNSLPDSRWYFFSDWGWPCDYHMLFWKFWSLAVDSFLCNSEREQNVTRWNVLRWLQSTLSYLCFVQSVTGASKTVLKLVIKASSVYSVQSTTPKSVWKRMMKAITMHAVCWAHRSSWCLCTLCLHILNCVVSAYTFERLVGVQKIS